MSINEMDVVDEIMDQADAAGILNEQDQSLSSQEADRFFALLLASTALPQDLAASA